MFCGIIEDMGLVTNLETQGTNIKIFIQSKMSKDAYIDQSISHNGVCLTVTEVHDGIHCVVAIAETLQKSNLGLLQVGGHVNLERSMRADQRVDGHFVQGHVDCTARCLGIENLDGSWTFKFSLEKAHTNLVVMKGSIAVNGTSLTISHVDDNSFAVSIIPYTYENTTFKYLNVGDLVNVEFDILGKYILKNFANHLGQNS